MATFLIMPKLRMTMESGVITKWLKREGEVVKKGEPVFALETDKLNAAAEASADGVLRKILVPEWTEVNILAEVGIIAGAEEDISGMLGSQFQEANAGPAVPQQENTLSTAVPVQPREDCRIMASPRAKAVARELNIDLTDVKPTGPDGQIVEWDVRARKASVPKASSLRLRLRPI